MRMTIPIITHDEYDLLTLQGTVNLRTEQSNDLYVNVVPVRELILVAFFFDGRYQNYNEYNIFLWWVSWYSINFDRQKEIIYHKLICYLKQKN